MPEVIRESVMRKLSAAGFAIMIASFILSFHFRTASAQDETPNYDGENQHGAGWEDRPSAPAPAQPLTPPQAQPPAPSPQADFGAEPHYEKHAGYPTKSDVDIMQNPSALPLDKAIEMTEAKLRILDQTQT